MTRARVTCALLVATLVRSRCAADADDLAAGEAGSLSGFWQAGSRHFRGRS
jgi:hypothetical protein